MDDHLLLEQFAATAEQAPFDQLVQRYAALVHGACYRLLRDAHASEDAVQATFMVLMRKAGAVARHLEGRPLAGWLQVTAHRCALQIRRSQIRRRHHERLAAADRREDQVEDDIEIARSLDGALATLSPAQRNALLLRYVQGLSQEEAAEAMGCSRETVHTHVTRGLSKMRELLRQRAEPVGASAVATLLSSSAQLPLPDGLLGRIHAACFPGPHAALVGGKALKAVHLTRRLARASHQAGAHASWGPIGLLGTAAVALTGGLLVWAHLAGAPAAVGTPEPVSTPVLRAAPLAAAQPQPVCCYRGHPIGVIGVVFDADGATATSASWDKSIQRWRVSDGQRLAAEVRHSDGVHGLAGVGELLATVSGDGTTVLWHRQPLAAYATLHGHHGRVLSVAISPDASRLATGGMDATVRLWSAQGEPGPVLHCGDSVWGLAFSPDGRLLASGSDDHQVTLWDAQSGAQLAVLAGHTDCLRTVAFSPDGSLLASGGNDHCVRLWDVASHALVRTIPMPAYVWSVAISPDGRWLATGCTGGAWLWDRASGACCAGPVAGPGIIESVAFSPDGTLLATAGDDAVVRLWRSQELVAAHQGAPAAPASGPAPATAAP